MNYSRHLICLAMLLSSGSANGQEPPRNPIDTHLFSPDQLLAVWHHQLRER